ncbi:MAG TPA: hypothetical protein VGS58_10675, partial [Candidatus Sulfopaludibacter sp.]|nr:hypothetical protein [Candidatus Sulfopaludibacter sp.]
LAWKQQVPLLMANLTGALRLLTGLGWPLIYATAALFYRRRHHKPLAEIRLEEEQSVEVVGLAASMVYAVVIWWKHSLNLWDAGILVAIYVGYLAVLRRMPAEDEENIQELELVPRTIVHAPPAARTAAIVGLFMVGGALIYFMAEPFLSSLLALSASLGVPNFVFVQWVAPFVSEFPEKVSALYWARTVERASTALMNMVSSNINQWTLLAAMLPIVFSISAGAPASIPLDGQQEVELLLTLAQQTLGLMFLLEMRLTWRQAAGLFALWAAQFALSTVGSQAHRYVSAIYFAWAALEAARMARRKRRPPAVRLFGVMWRRHVGPA